MPMAWPAVIGKGVQARITRQVAGQERDGAASRITNEVIAEGSDRCPTIWAAPSTKTTRAGIGS
jgi:hypothetical protein